MLHIERLSRAYRVRRLTEEDTAQILALCRSNPLYYRHCGTEPSEADIRQDMTLLPPGAAPEDKYFLGYFHGDRLAAVLDLIDGYPSAETAYIGLFMVDGRFSGQGIGSRLVEELLEELKKFDLNDVVVDVEDKGALDFVIRSRLQCAICRGAEISYNWAEEDGHGKQ